MRTTMVLLAVAVLVVVVVAACRAREDSTADTATDDSARADGTATDTVPAAADSGTTRPQSSQVTPEKRPRTWRGFKLPEETPVRRPIEPFRRVERVSDSVLKTDSTRPAKPNR